MAALDSAVILSPSGEICVIIHADEGDNPDAHERTVAHFVAETKAGVHVRIAKADYDAAPSLLEVMRAAVGRVLDPQIAANVQAKIDAEDAHIAADIAQKQAAAVALAAAIAQYEKETGKPFDQKDRAAFDLWLDALALPLS